MPGNEDFKKIVSVCMNEYTTHKSALTVQETETIATELANVKSEENSTNGQKARKAAREANEAKRAKRVVALY